MRHFIKQTGMFVLLAAMGLAGCKKDFLDVNSDPNRVSDDNITPELIFPAAAEGTGATIVGARGNGAGATTNTQFLQDWLGYMAGNKDFARNQQETTYNIDFSFANTLWVTWYGVLFDLHQAEKNGLEKGDTAITGASMILSAKIFQDLVDLFGDIPYSEAFDITKTRPAYDKADVIYKALQVQLDSAIYYMSFNPPGKFTAADIVTHGKPTLWIKFANTLKLRLLIRQSNVSGLDPKPELDKIFAAGSPGVLGAGESISVNPGYVNDLNKQSPFYANFGYTNTGTIAAPGVNANNYVVNLFKKNNDPRLGRFFLPVTCGGTDFVGNDYGADPGDINSGANSSYFGPALVGELGDECAITGIGATQPQWILPSYESLFFKAEAIALGWLTTQGTARDAYEAAVTESFVWTKVPNADSAAAAYLVNADSANFDNAGTGAAQQDRFIVFQKYLANTGVDPLESYNDQRRLNFLPPGFITKNVAKVSTTLPLRLLYPQSEFTTNAENVLAEGTIDAFHTRIFWEP